MDLQVNRKAISLFMQIFNSKSEMKPLIEEKGGKPFFKESEIKQAFERVYPEEVGFPSEKIIEFYEKIKNDDELNMHNVMIIKDGKIISEISFEGYKQNIWHITHSECKSITGLAIGMLVDDKKINLDERIVDIFAEECNPLSKISHRSIKVKDLLTMRSGVSFGEMGAIVETKWIEKYFESPPGLDTGKKFFYNSMNSYMLSAIVKKKSGKNMMEFLKERMFDPLGIENIYWEKSPEGIEKGGWGLYIIPEDLAKIGQLVLNKGLWNKKRIISKKWIEEYTKSHAKTPNVIGEFDYGYHVWVREHSNTFLFNGMFGQNMIGNFDSNILVLLNAGNDDVFQSSSIFKYYDEVFNEYKNKKEIEFNKRANKQLNEIKKELSTYPKIKKRTVVEQLIFERKRKKFFDQIIGSRWDVNQTITNTTSILPFFVQAVQNNFTKGISEFWFEKVNQKNIFAIREVDEIYKIPFSFDEYEYIELVFHGEAQRIAVSSHAALNENGSPVLTLKLSFLEIASTRIIKLIFEKDNKISMELKENPGKDLIVKAIRSTKEQLIKKPILNSFNIPLTDELISFLIETVTNPKVKAIKKDPM
jgi:CubicO group peptidase (beta-lactamase class C family)